MVGCGEPEPKRWYAQHGEDKTIEQLLGKRRMGFFIDIGAQDPVTDSVTKHFYDEGWTGVNIEPVFEHFQDLQKARPRDLNLQLVVSDENDEEQPFIYIPGTGLSTIHAENANRAVARGHTQEMRYIHRRTLQHICELYVPVGHIDFLKIDVEGSEEAVIRGHDWERWRPELVIVEATHPCTDEPSYHGWEPYLLEQGYELVHDDGLNRFYRECAILTIHETL
jgi:FkbM family methyltransferase